MPFIDFNTDQLQFENDEFDVTIVGAGAAGIVLAVKLAEKGMKVLLLEAGHFKEDEKRQVLNNVEQTGKFLGNAVWGRKRAIGGSTIAWGGQSLPFSKMDFEKRDWVPMSGWPIQYEDLAPYYPQANKFMQVDVLDYEGDVFKLLGMKAPHFNKSLLHYHFAKWAPEADFRKLYEGYLRAHVTVVYNAVLTKIDVGADGKAEKITIQNFNKGKYTTGIKQLVLATGAIEANRTLLLNKLGNNEWVGKCFMDHPCVATGTIETMKQYKLQSYLNTHVKQKRKYSMRLSLSADEQRKNKLLNGSANIMAVYSDEAFDPYQEIKNFIRTKSLPAVKNLFTNTTAYTLSAKAYTVDKFIYKHNATVRLALMLEQEPVKESYIALSEETDMFGLQKGKIHWQVSHKSWETAMALTDNVAEELNRLSLGKVVRYEYAYADNKNWAEHLTDVNHHMGGARMSETRDEGVVNKDLKMWGHDNVYICSTAAYPTGSHSNPTLTLMALAIRLADKLAK